MGLDVTYKGQQIAQLTEDGNLTLETAGKYCEDDIELSYTGGGAPERTITIVDASLNNTSNFDTYFGALIADWDTAPLFLAFDGVPSRTNMLICGFSAYANSNGLTQIYRLYEPGGNCTAVTRNSWAINITAGDTYKIVEFGD